MQALTILNSLSAIKNLQELGGEIFLVGGIVRDHFLNKESKDIDIIVRNVEEHIIKEVLEQCGRIASDDEDGKTGSSFGVFKFFPKEVKLKEAIDVALPRTERLMTDEEFAEAVAKEELKPHNRHKAFVVTSDPNLPIEEDLKRRDFTINSIAMKLDGTLVDPFDGVGDLERKILKATSDKAFIDDPLRMMRGVQFDSRLDGFDIDENTWNLIIKNKEDIKHITGERILTELDKIFEKGDNARGFSTLIKSGLCSTIFKSSFSIPFELTPHFISLIETREDFFSFLVDSGKEFKTILKGDNDTADGIDAIKMIEGNLLRRARNIGSIPSKPELRHLLSNAIKKSATILNSGLANSNPDIAEIIEEFKSGKMPKNTKELALNGFDLMDLGFQNADIGIKQRFLIDSVFKEEVENTKEALKSIL